MFGFMKSGGRAAAGLILFSLMSCEIPQCGPGPQDHMGFIWYTDPANHSVTRENNCISLDIHFRRPVLKSSFNMFDDIMVYQIPNYYSMDMQFVAVAQPFVRATWSCEQCTDDGPYADVLSLTLGFCKLPPHGQFDDIHYLVRLMGQKTDEPLENRPQSVIEDEQGNKLPKDFDIYLGIASDEAPWDAPVMQRSTLEGQMCSADETCYVIPHGSMKVEFSRLMAYVDLNADPFEGVNTYTIYHTSDGQGTTSLFTDSQTGMLPGRDYSLEIKAVQEPVESGHPGTIDSFGNPLQTGVTYSFRTGAVRIELPGHRPKRTAPDDWRLQLNELGYDGDELFFMVSVSEDVDMLTTYGPNGPDGEYYSDIEFDTYHLTEAQKHDGQVIRIDARPRYDCSPQEPMEIFRDQRLTVHAWHMDEHGQLEWLGADSLEVDPYPEPENTPVMYPDQYEYLGSYPSDFGADDWWTDNLQGVTTDGQFWYFSQTEWDGIFDDSIPKLRIFNIEDDLGKDSPRHTVDLRGLLGDFQTFNHVGDISYFEHDGSGYLIMGLDNDDNVGICAIMRIYHHHMTYPEPGLAAWTYMEHNTNAPWIAVDNNGDIYTSNSSITESDGIKKYRVDWDLVSKSYQEQVNFLEYTEEIFPVDESGQRMEILIVQGGVFSPKGHLFYIVNGYSSSGDGFPSEEECRIRVFKTDGWVLHRQSVNSTEGIFRFQVDHNYSEEPEGLTFYQSENTIITGQLHVILLENKPLVDGLYFKHYSAPAGETCKL